MKNLMLGFIAVMGLMVATGNAQADIISIPCTFDQGLELEDSYSGQCGATGGGCYTYSSSSGGVDRTFACNSGGCYLWTSGPNGCTFSASLN